jgi:hypothetical protein
VHASENESVNTYSTLDSRLSGLALSTTKIKMGTKASALSSFLRWRIRPSGVLKPGEWGKTGWRTKDDLATVKNTDKFVSGSLVVIDLEELCDHL